MKNRERNPGRAETLSREGRNRAGDPADVALAYEGRADWAEPEVCCVLGQPFHRITQQDALGECLRVIEGRGQAHFLTANLDFVTQMQGSQLWRRILFYADRVFCDGQPMVWLSKLFGHDLPERVTGSDLTPQLLTACAKRGYKVFLFGSDEETMARLRTVLPQLYPGLEIAGAIAPPYGPLESWDHERYVREVRGSRADVLLVALGFPKQDVWIHRFRSRLGVPLSIGVGASLDFLAGKQRRAPRWMRRTGLEWTWRLGTDPRRLLKRYVLDLGCLIRLVSVECRSRWQWRGKRETDAVLPGASVPGVAVVYRGPQDRARVLEAVDGAEGALFVVDFSQSRDAGSMTRSFLCVLARKVARMGKRIALFGVDPGLGRWIEEIGLGEELPHFQHPQALRAWAWACCRNGREYVPELTAPGDLQSGRVRRFQAVVAEVLRRTKSPEVRISLRDTWYATVDGILELSRWKQKEKEAGRELLLEDASEEVADLLRLTGLDGLLSKESDRRVPSAAEELAAGEPFTDAEFREEGAGEWRRIVWIGPEEQERHQPEEESAEILNS